MKNTKIFVKSFFFSPSVLLNIFLKGYDMFKFRLISFPLLFLLLGMMLYCEWGKYLFLGMAVFGIGSVSYEILSMFRRVELRGYPLFGGGIAGFLGLILCLLLIVIPSAVLGFVIFIFLSLLIPAAVFLWVLLCNDKREFLERIFNTLGVVYLTVMAYGLLVVIYVSTYLTPVYFLYFILVTKMMDTGGYIFGKLSHHLLPGGNHKIFPKISPKKSYEGTIGGILLSLTVGLLFYYWGYSPFSFEMTIISSVVLAIGSFAGDLTESAIKRTCDVKDSGAFIPGMGGAFDVLDSFLYNNAIFLVMLFYCKM